MSSVPSRRMPFAQGSWAAAWPTTLVTAAIVFGGTTAVATAQTAATVPASSASAATAPRMDRLAGVWIDGPGYDIDYGGSYDACAARCLAAGPCQMIEYYRPEKKCNMYTVVRPRLKGGSSDVALKR